MIEPRKKLEMLRTAMLTVGVEEASFDKAWGKLAVKAGGNLEKVCTMIVPYLAQALQSAADGDLNGMD